MTSVLPDSDAYQVYNTLTSLGCCLRCILRFLGVPVFENESLYKKPQQYFEKFGCNNGGESLPLKKIKLNPCPTCLNCFDDLLLQTIAEQLKTSSVNQYNYNTYMLNISFPKSVPIRTHSICLHLKTTFPLLSLYNEDVEKPENNLELPHKIFRTIASDIFANAIGKDYSPKSNLTILIALGYEDDESEIEDIKNLEKKKFLGLARNYHRKNIKKNEFSRNVISELLNDVDPKQFIKLFSVPPVVPTKFAFLEAITIQADPIYIGGRYLKFKRNVAQTPWVVDGANVVEHNVQDIIFDAIQNVTGIDKNKMTFTASGREDIDVRMLGKGRPFYIKIDDAYDGQIPKSSFDKIQEEIIATELVAVIQLQNVLASDTKIIKTGEIEKRKTYKALCHTFVPNVQDAVDIINGISRNLEISQLTCMRVLHRRTMLSRKKKVHKIFASAIPGQHNLFELDVETDAGTYIKELT
ncbi:putative tRNA pseudouridine synthase Pus10 isoform X2 [Cylas formicarius]|uniref:putative tRNA pseudouridine synthase Pus10 isoform X2 n=1 Tax=Cylas formicarius TaxID=197179 RepID=UPI002958B186|nr:putative tRNA pseudouridine synthase Pus10 isoform X2 [Cylas formicarius]